MFRASHWLLLIAALLSAPLGSFACTCGHSTQQQAICKAEWISHVQLGSNATAEGNGEEWVIYQAVHLEKFKVPSSVGNDTGAGELDATQIRTPALSSVCGVTDLEEGKEYLLAGSVTKAGGGTGANCTGDSGCGDVGRSVLSISTCLEIPLVDGKFNPHPGAVEWAQVGEELRKKLGEVASGKLKCG